MARTLRGFFADLAGSGITAVSTGDVSSCKIKNYTTGKVIADSVVLETLSRRTDGRVARINFVVQVTPTSNPERNINYWVYQRAAGINSPTMVMATQNRFIRALRKMLRKVLRF